MSVTKLIAVRELSHLWRLSRFETAIAATCFAGILLIGPLAGIVLAFILSLINLLRKAARPAVDVLQGSDDPHLSLTASQDGAGETVPGVIAMRFAAPIFFGNAATLSAVIRQSVREAPHPVSAFILDMEGGSATSTSPGPKRWPRNCSGCRARASPSPIRGCARSCVPTSSG